MKRTIGLLLLLNGPAMADTLLVPPVVERAGEAVARFAADPPLTAPARLVIDWTDALGRLVARHEETLAPGAAARMRLDLARARAMDNRLSARLERPTGPASTEARFIARPPPDPWRDFQVITYREQAPARHEAMRALGVSAIKVLGHRVPFAAADVAPRIAPPLAGDFRWYVENIATDFYSPYHMWTPEHPNQVHFRFLDAQARHRANPADLAVFERTPSLSDAAWLTRIRERLAEHVRHHAPYRPLYYSLGDEPGIADLAAHWDFDRSPPALAAFRAWLRLKRGDLAAVNAAWGSAFATWGDVLPETTTAAMARRDDNFTAWNDHKQFMDEAFAAALRAGTEALRAADPEARAGIEGGQIPGWGGWNYATLAGAVDVMEIYESGRNLDIALGLQPDLVALATSFARDDAERRRLWRAALRGIRGVVLWDDNDDIIADGGKLGPAGAAMKPMFDELRGGLGALLIASPPVADPVAVLYSPESYRIRWMLDHRAAGDAWTERDSEKEGLAESVLRRAIRGSTAALQAAGITPAWLTRATIEAGALRHGPRLLVLPDAIALSDAEAAEIAAFAAAGGIVLAEGETGRFDGDGARRATPALPEGTIRSLAMPDALAAAGVAPAIRLSPGIAQPGAPTVTVRANGAVRLIGVASARDGQSRALDRHPAQLPTRAFVRDIRTNAPWAETDSPAINLDRDGVAILAVSPAPTPPPRLTAPARLRPGETATLVLGLDGPTPAAATILALTVTNPAGHTVDAYGGTLRAPARATIPFALNDPAGTWTITIHDPLGGTTTRGSIELAP